MRLFTLALIPLLTLNACVYYEYSGDGDDREWNWEDYLNGDDDGDDPSCVPCEDDDDLIDAGLTLSPDSAQAGDTFIATIASDNGTNLSGVVDVLLDGPCEILAIDASSGGVTIAVTVDDDAGAGDIDLWVAFDDGSTAHLEGALEVQPAGSAGHDDGDTCP